MTSLLEGARRLVTRGSDLGGRIEALQSAAEAARGRLDDDLVDRGRGGRRARRRPAPALGRPHRGRDRRRDRLGQVLDVQRADRPRAVRRRRTPPDHVVGDRLRLGERGCARSCSSGSASRRATRPPATRCSTLGAHRPPEDREMEGVVLLDLPDHDSTEVSHHLEVDRLVKLADLLVWVLDPQKYADAAIHDRYLAPLASHAGVMLVVLNHIDTVPADRREGDARRRPPPARPRRAARGPGDRRPAPARARASPSSAPRSPAGWRRRRRPGSASRPTCAPSPPALNEACGTGKPRSLAAGRVAGHGRRARRRRRRADRGRGRRAVHPDAGRPRHRLAGRLVALAAQARPAHRLHLDLGAAGKQLTGRRAHVGAGGDAACSAPGRHRGARAGRRGVGRDGPAVGGRRAAGLGLAAPRPRRPARPRDRRHRPRCRQDPGLGRPRAGAAVAADPRRARRRWLAARARRLGLAGDDSVPSLRRASRSRSCCCSAGSASASCWRCCAAPGRPHGPSTGRRGGQAAPRRRARGLRRSWW